MAIYEGPIKQEFHFQEHTGTLTAVKTQPTEKIILERNAELRKSPGVVRDLGHGSEGGSWGRQVASIPFIMFQKALKDGYDLTNKDAKHAANEMQRFLATSDGKLCLMQGKH